MCSKIPLGIEGRSKVTMTVIQARVNVGTKNVTVGMIGNG